MRLRLKILENYSLRFKARCAIGFLLSAIMFWTKSFSLLSGIGEKRRRWLRRRLWQVTAGSVTRTLEMPIVWESFPGSRAWRMSKNFGFNKFDTKIEFRFWAIVSLARWVEGEEWKSAAFGYSGNLILLEITIPNPVTKVSNKNVTKQPLWSVDCVHSTPFLVYKRLFCKFSRPFCLITSFQLVWASL